MALSLRQSLLGNPYFLFHFTRLSPLVPITSAHWLRRILFPESVLLRQQAHQEARAFSGNDDSQMLAAFAKADVIAHGVGCFRQYRAAEARKITHSPTASW